MATGAPGAPRWVLVKGGSFFHTRVPPAGQRVHNLSMLSPQGRTFAFRYRLLGEQGDYVEVEVPEPGAPGAHCRPETNVFGKLSLRLRVARADLAAVTTRPVAREFPDGTRFALAPGVPLSDPLPRASPNGPVLRTAYVNAFNFDVDVPDDSIGSSYVSQAAEASSPGNRVIDRDAQVTLNGASLTLSGLRGDQSSQDREGNPFVVAETPHEGRVFADLHGACGTFRVLAPASSLHAARTETPDFPGPWMLFDVSYSVRGGVKVYDPDGGEIGRVLADEWQPGEGAMLGEHRCFERSLLPNLALEPEAFLRVCFDPKDLTPAPGLASDEETGRVTAATREYLRVQIDNKTGRPDSEIQAIVRKAVKNLRIAQGASLAIAPAGESRAEADRKTAKKKLDRKLVVFTLSLSEDLATATRADFDEATNPAKGGGSVTQSENVRGRPIEMVLLRLVGEMFKPPFPGE